MGTMAAVLTVWESDYGVPSVDIDSLILVTYVKFAKIQCTVKYGRNPLFCNMPKLYIEEEGISEEFVGFQEIWKYFRAQVFDIDHFISVEQKSECRAYHMYMQKSLLPGIYVTLWLDTQNYIEVTRKWFRNAVLFPVNLWYPYHLVTKITNYMKVLAPDENIEDYSYLFIDEAKRCISDLSTKLGSKSYFFGSTPSTLDALVYGYLAPLLNVPVPTSPLQTYLREQENLVKFVKKLTATYFPQLKFEYKHINKIQHEEDLQDFKTPPTTIAMTAFCVAAAMVTYGIIHGIIKLPS